jgi:hypothetical protein
LTTDRDKFLLFAEEMHQISSGQRLHQYPVLRIDGEGKPLTGANHYTLHFAKGELPPVHALWSATMYELPQSLLVANPINRYLINSPMIPELKTDTDGGTTLYIQNETPGKKLESNRCLRRWDRLLSICASTGPQKPHWTAHGRPLKWRR